MRRISIKISPVVYSPFDRKIMRSRPKGNTNPAQRYNIRTVLDSRLLSPRATSPNYILPFPFRNPRREDKERAGAFARLNRFNSRIWSAQNTESPLPIFSSYSYRAYVKYKYIFLLISVSIEPAAGTSTRLCRISRQYPWRTWTRNEEKSDIAYQILCPWIICAIRYDRESLANRWRIEQCEILRY